MKIHPRPNPIIADRVRITGPTLQPIGTISTVKHPLTASDFESAATGAADADDRIDFAADPYPDYSMQLTDEGGIEINYKTWDQRFRYKVLAVSVWLAATSFDFWFLERHSPIHNVLLNTAALIAAMVINKIIVSKPIEVYRKVEILPDRMVLDNEDTFFVRHMQGMPQFAPGGIGWVLSGIYGTRLVEFLEVPILKDDEADKTGEVLSAHLQYAMEQLWTRPNGDPSTAPAPAPKPAR